MLPEAPNPTERPLIRDAQLERRFFKSDVEEKCSLIREAVRELYEPSVEVLRQALPGIENGEYTMLISDDTSGRIPAAILRQVIDAIYAELRFSPLVFGGFTLSGSNHSKYNYDDSAARKAERHAETLVKQSKKRRPRTPPKALVVSDVIWTGNTMNRIGNALTSVGIQTDFAGMLVKYGTHLTESFGGKVFDGGMERNPKIWLLSYLRPHGLEKKENEVVAREHPLTDDASKAITQAAFEEVRRLAQEIFLTWKVRYQSTNS